jgi:hypothetical protein
MSFKVFRKRKTTMIDRNHRLKKSLLDRNPILIREKTDLKVKPDGLKDFCTLCMKHYVG